MLVIVAYAALAPTSGAFIYQRENAQSRADRGADSLLAAINDIQRDLHATTNEIALSLSLFILVQGNFPLIWSAISEVKGRKFVYIFAMIVRLFIQLAYS